MRKAIKGYNLEFLNAMLSLFTGIIIIAYLMYTISPEVMQHWNTYRLVLYNIICNSWFNAIFANNFYRKR